MRKVGFLALWIILTGFAQTNDEEVKFWEWPYPERSTIIPQLAAAAKTEAKGGSESLEFLVELNSGNTRRQWIVSVAKSDTEVPQESEMESITFYCSTGDIFKFESVLQSLKLSTQGPAIMKKDRLSRKSEMERKIEQDVFVSQDFLMLGFDRIADFTLSMNRENKPKTGLGIGTEPFPPEEVSIAKAQFEELGISLDQIRSIVGLAPSLNSFFDLLMSTPGVRDILMEVVDRPSFFSLMTKGLQLHFNARGEGVLVENPLNWGLDAGTSCYRLPITILLNGHEALYTMLIVRSVEDPFSLTAGVVGIIAYKPEDSHHTLTIRLRD